MYKELKQLIQAPTKDDLRHWVSTRSNYGENEFYTLFDGLHEAMTKAENVSELLTQPQSGDFPGYEESPSSHEDEPEEPSRQIIHGIASVLVKVLSKSEADYGIQV